MSQLTATMNAHGLPLSVLEGVLETIGDGIEDAADIVRGLTMLSGRLAARGFDAAPIDALRSDLERALAGASPEPLTSPVDVGEEPSFQLGDGRRWQRPEPVQQQQVQRGASTASTATTVLAADQVARWRSKGWLVVDGIWPEPLIAEARRQAQAVHLPQPKSTQEPAPRSHTRFPQHPTRLSAVIQIALCPRLLQAAAQLLGLPDAHGLRLIMSNLLPKHGSWDPATTPLDEADVTEELHQDFGNNTLVVPPLTEPDAVIVILYYTDVERCLGSTLFVPNGHFSPSIRHQPDSDTSLCVATPARGGGLQREKYPELYATERAVQYAPGTALLFRADTYHRGSPVRAGQLRLTQHIILRKATAEWVQSDAFVRHLSTYGELVDGLEPIQRSVLGFPPPAHPHWAVPSNCEQAVGRYPSFDPAAYSATIASVSTGSSVFHDMAIEGMAHGHGGGVEERGGGRGGDVFPVSAQPLSAGSAPLTAEQVRQWQEEGWLLVSGIWPPELIARAAEAIDSIHSVTNPVDNTAGATQQQWRNCFP